MNIDDEVLQARLAEIRALPPDQQAVALEQLSRDYPGIERMLQGDRAFAESMATTPMPEGGVAGPGSNPFSIYVAANPLEHIAAAGNQIMGHRDRRAASKEMRQNQLDQQEQLMASMSASLRGGQKTPWEQWEEDKRRGYRGMPGRRF
jgi:hypothetical protein